MTRVIAGPCVLNVYTKRPYTWGLPVFYSVKARMEQLGYVSDDKTNWWSPPSQSYTMPHQALSWLARGEVLHVREHHEIPFLLPHDAMHKRGPSVHLSVCPSGWRIVSRWLKLSLNFFFGPVPMILVFLTPAPIPNSKGRYPIQPGR